MGQKLKYLILAAIVVLCALNCYSALGIWSPWEAFSLLTALRLPQEGSGVAVLLLVLIVVGMALQERFFCQFLCPMGAVFSLLPILPFGQLRRAADRCPSGCELCKRRCPVSVRMDEDNLRKALRRRLPARQSLPLGPQASAPSVDRRRSESVSLFRPGSRPRSLPVPLSLPSPSGGRGTAPARWMRADSFRTELVDEMCGRIYNIKSVFTEGTIHPCGF